MTLMTLPSRNTPSVRCEDYGRARLPVQVPIAQWTLAERVANARIENKMLAAIEGSAPIKNNLPDSSAVSAMTAVSSAMAKERSEEALQRVLSRMDEPTTASRIAEGLGVTTQNVFRHLRALHAQGRARKVGTTVTDDNRNRTTIWVKA